MIARSAIALSVGVAQKRVRQVDIGFGREVTGFSRNKSMQQRKRNLELSILNPKRLESLKP